MSHVQTKIFQVRSQGWGTKQQLACKSHMQPDQFWALGQGAQCATAAEVGQQPWARWHPSTLGASQSVSQAVLCQLAHPLHPGIGPQ